jgi:hypothetical protein
MIAVDEHFPDLWHKERATQIIEFSIRVDQLRD